MSVGSTWERLASSRSGWASSRSPSISRPCRELLGTLAQVPLAPELDSAVLVGWPAAASYPDFDGHPATVYTRSRDSQVPAVRDVLAATGAVALVGGVGGVLIGFLVTTGYAVTQQWPVWVLGAVAGLHPAIRAARSAPSEALASL
jgi:hypothetical protein